MSNQEQRVVHILTREPHVAQLQTMVLERAGYQAHVHGSLEALKQAVSEGKVDQTQLSLLLWIAGAHQYTNDIVKLKQLKTRNDEDSAQDLDAAEQFLSKLPVIFSTTAMSPSMDQVYLAQVEENGVSFFPFTELGNSEKLTYLINQIFTGSGDSQ